MKILVYIYITRLHVIQLMIVCGNVVRRVILFTNAMTSADALEHVRIVFCRMEYALNLKSLEQKAR